ncbi:MAG: hypothetical protein LDL13_04915 [Calditerrivibrio sp.]|nr:hypothetical protein [Calditerrivibrio sp.]MCA1932899.1 hypothetical protein [Calditerrivibrio sp.]MCA1979956.1 hypothetical protein [Calditerrivibrio sp.]
MVIGGDNSIINLKDRLLKLEKKTSPPKSSSEGDKEHNDSKVKTDNTLIDFLRVREENILASKNGGIKDQDEAISKMNYLKSMFQKDISLALSAHKKTDPNKVMKFYPFE